LKREISITVAISFLWQPSSSRTCYISWPSFSNFSFYIFKSPWNVNIWTNS